MAHTRLRTLYYFLFGILAALPVVLTQLGVLSFLAFIPLCLLFFKDLERGYRLRYYFWRGFVFLMGYFMATFHWFLYLWPLDFVAGMTPFTATLVVVAACVGLPFLQAIGFAPLFLILATLERTDWPKRCPALRAPLFAAGWTVFAFTQTLTWAGVPWGAQLALSLQKCLPLLSSSAYFGSYFVTFVIALVNALFALAILALARGERRAAGVLALVSAGAFVLNLGLSTLSYLSPVEEKATIRVAALQGNLASADKWNSAVDAIAIYEELAHEATAEGAELMVWPETAITSSFAEGSGTRNRVRAIAAETNAVQIVGAFARVTEENGTVSRRNSLFVVYPDGRVSEARYDKRHLVPFGEYVPMGDVIRTLLPFLANLEMLNDGSEIHPGEDPALFYEEFGTLGGLICFDTIYEALARESVAAGAEALVIGTNDSWFLNSAAVYMHNGQAILRAVENKRAVVRAANTGISSVFSYRGEEVGYLDPLVKGQLTADITLVGEKTLYTQIGDLFVLLAQIFFLSPAIWQAALALKKRMKKD